MICCKHMINKEVYLDPRRPSPDVTASLCRRHGVPLPTSRRPSPDVTASLSRHHGVPLPTSRRPSADVTASLHGGTLPASWGPSPDAKASLSSSSASLTGVMGSLTRRIFLPVEQNRNAFKRFRSWTGGNPAFSGDSFEAQDL